MEELKKKIQDEITLLEREFHHELPKEILRARECSLSELDMAKALQALRNAMATGDAQAARAVAMAYVEGYGDPVLGADPAYAAESLPRG